MEKEVEAFSKKYKKHSIARKKEILETFSARCIIAYPVPGPSEHEITQNLVGKAGMLSRETRLFGR